MIFEDSIFFHEDNYCQIELLPMQNLFIKRREIDFSQDHSAINFAEDGFINITSRSQTTYPLTNLNIVDSAFQNILRVDSLFYFDKVYTGYSTQRLFKEAIHGFAFENYIVYFEVGNNLIMKSWIDYNSLSDTLNGYPERLQTALYKLGKSFDLILIDWNELITVALKNKIALMHYVKEVL